MSEIRIWDALIAWRNDILKRDIRRSSKIDYLSNMIKLIEIGIVSPHRSLAEWVNTGIKGDLQNIAKMISWTSSTKRYREILLRSFYKFSKQHKIDSTHIEIPINASKKIDILAAFEILSSNEDKVSSQYLTKVEINFFLSELMAINHRDYLICRVMWDLKCPLHTAINLKTQDYDPIQGFFKVHHPEAQFGRLGDDLRDPLLKYCADKNQTDLIFSTDKGKPIHPGQMVRNMKLASRRAQLPVVISPKIIYAHAKAFYENAFLALPTTIGEHGKTAELFEKLI